LKEGQQVQYEAAESPRGVQTTRVVGQSIEQNTAMSTAEFAQSPE
jgi:cold shock CspA family protein